MPQYQHTQIGYVTIIALLFAVFLNAYLAVMYGISGVVWVVLLILLVCLVLFATLTITLDKEIMTVRFGVGIINKKFFLKDIATCSVAKNPWYYGWGVRFTPHGWLFNVSGFDAVETVLKNGKSYRIGTDEPAKLEEAIKQAIASI